MSAPGSIGAVKGDTVTFEMRTTAPFFVRMFRRKYLSKYKQAGRVAQGVPVVVAAWIAALLAQLTPQQIRDAFRAAGTSRRKVDGFAKVVEKRIVAMNHLKES